MVPEKRQTSIYACDRDEEVPHPVVRAGHRVCIHDGDEIVSREFGRKRVLCKIKIKKKKRNQHPSCRH